MRFAAIVLLAHTAFAQDLPEFRGTVAEYSTNVPIGAAEVTLYEFVTVDGVYTRRVVAKVLTDNRGTFTLKPDHPGNYFAEVNKPTYLTPQELDTMGPVLGYHRSEASLAISREPLPDPRFTLIRTGGLTGRVVDENDKPVPDFTVTAPAPGIPVSLGAKAVTNKEGVFTFDTLVPSQRMILVSAGEKAMSLDYAPDEEIETAYWPGGVTDPSLVLPINMIPGAVVNVGTIRIRKIRYYSAHITYKGACLPGEKWSMRLAATSVYYSRDCASEFTVGSLLPGSQTLLVWKSEGEMIAKWAVIPIAIDRENVELLFNFTPSTDVPVRIVNADGGKLPPLGNMRVRLGAIGGGPSGRMLDRQIEGAFTIPAVPWPRQIVEVTAVPNLAVKEMRYGSQSVSDGTITIAPGAPLEIVVDDKPGSIAGSTDPSARVFVVKWPFVGIMNSPQLSVTQADETGRFQVGSLGAGEYRAIALRDGLKSPQQLSDSLAVASKITLARGAQQTIELKPVDRAR